MKKYQNEMELKLVNYLQVSEDAGYIDCGDYDIYFNLEGVAALIPHQNVIGISKLGQASYDDLKEIEKVIDNDEFKDLNEKFALIDQLIELCCFSKLDFEEIEDVADNCNINIGGASISIDIYNDDDDDDDFALIEVNGISIDNNPGGLKQDIRDYFNYYCETESDLQAKIESLIELKKQYIIEEMAADDRGQLITLDHVAELFDETGNNL